MYKYGADGDEAIYEETMQCASPGSSEDEGPNDKARLDEDDMFWGPQYPYTDVPLGPGILHMYAAYAKELLISRATGVPVPWQVVDGRQRGCYVPLACRGELETMTLQIYRAWNNRVKLNFSISEVGEALRTGGSKSRDQLVREKFAAAYPRNADGSFPLVDQPTAYIDRDDHVVAWYLPGVFPAERSVQVVSAVRSHGKDILRRVGEQRRSGLDRFANPEKCVVPPGSAKLSVCWYNQVNGQPNSLPSPSTNLNAVQGRLLLSSLGRTMTLIGALLALVHPEYYTQQIEVLSALQKDAERFTSDSKLTRAVLERWNSPFEALTLIANGEAEAPRDDQGGMFCLSVLSSFGMYQGGRLDVPLLGSCYVYNPGTAFVMPAYLFEHSASKTDGERICLASRFLPAVGRGVLGEKFQELKPPMATYLMEHWELSRPAVDRRDIWK